ncbi:MAG: alpha/beta fold hydrolase [Sandaracinaceae bacterium]
MALLRIRALGPLEVLRDEAPAPLPPSKKARALLAYLAVTGRAHSRSALCQLLWPDVHDPRGGLRWALSRLRSSLDAPSRIDAGRDAVGLSTDGVALDVLEVRRVLRSLGAGRAVPVDVLRRVAGSFRGEALEDLELPDVPAFHAWCIALRSEARGWRARLLDALVEALRGSPADALPHARARAELDRSDEAAHARLLRLLVDAGRGEEADAYIRGHERWLEGRGERPSAALRQVWFEVASRHREPATGSTEDPAEATPAQEIRMCTTPDGVRIAYATVGSGPPLVKTAVWLNHLEHDWRSPVWRPYLQALARGRTLVRYDQRANGLSDPAPAEVSVAGFLADLEAVLEATGLRRYPLLGVSQGAAVAIAHAARYPDRVTHLVLLNGFARGWRRRGTPDVEAMHVAMRSLIEHGWGRNDPVFRRVFSSLFFPDAPAEHLHAFDEVQRRSASPENAVRLFDSFGVIDVVEQLGRVRAPTLILHSRKDRIVPMEEGLLMASGIAGARFVPLESRSHILQPYEPAFATFLAELERALAA